jgi:FkbM family methyltransferase
MLLTKLRPTKVRRAVRRRWFEHQLSRIPLRDRVSTAELGSDYGSWVVPTQLIQPGWTCYSVGAGGDVSFDLALAKDFGVVVRSFDAVLAYVESARAEGDGERNFTAHQAAIMPRDGPVRMQVTHDPNSQSVSAAALYESASFVTLSGRSIASLMAEFDDDHVDILKVDVEGSEYDLLPALNLAELGVRIFAVQLHHTGSVRQARGLVDRIRNEGYEPVACSHPVKLTFVLRDLL